MDTKTYIFKQFKDGQRLEAKVFFKTGLSETSRPIALYFHGGNFVVGHKDMLSQAYAKSLIDLGFGAVVSPDYRLSPTITADKGALADAKESYEWCQTRLPQLLLSEEKVKLNGERIVTWGHSAGATLALLMASLPQKPYAILDLFGMKYLDDDFYHSPNAALAQIPALDENFVNQVYNDLPPPVAVPPPFGPNGPDLTKYRSAWFFDVMKNGKYLDAVAPASARHNIDPVRHFSASFPPTYFIHGTADTGVPARFSTAAHEELQKYGVESKLILRDNAPHGFDARAQPGDETFETVVEGFRFLYKHVS